MGCKVKVMSTCSYGGLRISILILEKVRGYETRKSKRI